MRWKEETGRAATPLINNLEIICSMAVVARAGTTPAASIHAGHRRAIIAEARGTLAEVFLVIKNA